VRRPAAVAAGAACAVALVAAWGAGARDLAGDEVNMLHGNPAQILQWSLDPRGSFVGHLPWSFWLRWASLTVFGEAPNWAWRLHAIAGGALAAALTGWSATRALGLGAGVLAALVVVADPVLAFHTQDASNYAWSAAVGAGTVAGLLELGRGQPRYGAALLGVSLVIGALNDYYSVLVAVPALALSLVWLRRPAFRRPLLAAWLAPVLVVLPIAVLLAARLWLSTGEAVVDVHADPIPPRPLPALLDAPWRVARRLMGAHLHGYAGGRDDGPWIGGPPVLLAVGVVAATLRSRAWPAAVVLAGALVVHGLLGVGLQLGAERMLPYEPRSLIGVTPALAVMLASLTTLRRSALGWGVATAWVWSAAIATTQANLLTADLRQSAATEAAQLLREGDVLVVPDAVNRARLPPDLQAIAQPCLDEDALQAIWIANHSAEDPPACAPPSGLVVHTRAAFDAPVHEGSAASFLPRRIVARVGPAPVPQRSQPATLDPSALLSGLADVRWELAREDGTVLDRADELTELDLPTDGVTVAFVSAFPRTRSRLPNHPLFSAHHNRVASWEVDPRAPEPTLTTTPFGAPTITTLRRLLPMLAVPFVLVLAISGRRDP